VEARREKRGRMKGKEKTDMETENKQKPTLREIIACIIFIGFIGTFFILNFIIPEPAVLESERRIPAKFPEVSLNAILTGAFMSGFDDYAADRFVFRDTFRMIHAFQILDVYRQTDKSGLYRCDAVGIGEFRRVDTTAFRQTAERIQRAANHVADMNMNIYYSIVPDKSVFAERYYPGFDLSVAEPILFDVLQEHTYIPLMDALDAGTFYRTDLHWDQSRISGVTSHILSAMGANPVIGSYPVNTAGEWNGVYAGQLALPVTSDIMTYVDVPGLSVKYLNDRTLEFEDGPLYDKTRFNGVDPYDMFLRGPQPLIVIENPSVPERELYLFRDSFGSSLAPLMMEAYSKITVIDLRYINLQVLDMVFEFKPGSDVLFIFSSQIFNNPSIVQA